MYTDEKCIYILFFFIIVIYNVVGERKSDMLLCVMLNGPKKVGLPRTYKSIRIICAAWTITDAVCLSARPIHWRRRLYDIRRKRSRDYAYGRGRLNEKNNRKKNTQNNKTHLFDGAVRHTQIVVFGASSMFRSGLVQ
jgi:hypothetical protein